MLTDRSMTGIRGSHAVSPSRHSGQHIGQEPGELSASVSPSSYRLPKLKPANESAAADSTTKGLTSDPRLPAGVFTRYGFVQESPEFGHSDSGNHSRSSGFSLGPTFNQAVMAPIWSPLMMMVQLSGTAAGENGGRKREPTDPSLRLNGRLRCTDAVAYSAFGRSIPRGFSTMSSDAELLRLEKQKKSETDRKAGVQWVMKPLRSFQVDKKGQQRNQGPFSREFVVHARAPPSWLRLKWGRPQ